MLTSTFNNVKKHMRKIPLTGWVLLYFVLMTLAMTYPLILFMKNYIIGVVGDNIYFVWMIGWFQKALFELKVNPFNVWFLNYPQGWNMAYTEITPGQLLIALPFSLILGPTFGYNATMMLSFILSGFGMYLWVRRITGRTGAALVAATAFAYLPYRFAHFLIGHLNLSGTQWFPLYFMGFFEFFGVPTLKNKGPVWKAVLLCGVSLGLIAMTSQYYLYMTLLVSGWIVICYLLFIDRKRIREWNFWKKLMLSAMVALPLVIVAVAPYVLLSSQGGLPDRSFSLVRLYSASPTDFILPSTDHFIWGHWVWAHFNRDMWVEGTLYVGIICIVLALLAWLKRKSLESENLLKLLLLGGLFALVLALGTDLHWNGAPVELPTPAFLSNLVHRQTIPTLLPGYLMFRFFPLYAKLRSTMRFGIFVLIFVCAAAGIGAAWLLGRINEKWRTLGTIVLIGLVILDFYPGPFQQYFRVQPRPVDYWLSEQPDKGAVAQMPFRLAENQENTYFTLIHGKPYIGGFFNAFPPQQYTRIKPVLDAFPDKSSVTLLHNLGVIYVLADIHEYNDLSGLRDTCISLGLDYVGEIGDQMVFLLTPK